MTSIRASRSRLWLFVCLGAVIALGLASRKFPFLFPAIFGKYPGDALWALMVFVGLAFLKPRTSASSLAVVAFAVSCTVELSQLYQAPWLDAIRATTVGHLVLGSTFSWLDIAAYAVGVLVGWLIDASLAGLARLRAGTRRNRHSSGLPSAAAEFRLVRLEETAHGKD